VLRAYPSLWQVYLEKEDGYELIAEVPEKPLGEVLENLILEKTTPTIINGEETVKPKKSGLFAGMNRFLKALNQ
jgi:hypothetical protein